MLIAQVYRVDPLTLSRCGSPEEIRMILRHLAKIGRIFGATDVSIDIPHQLVYGSFR